MGRSHRHHTSIPEFGFENDRFVQLNTQNLRGFTVSDPLKKKKKNLLHLRVICESKSTVQKCIAGVLYNMDLFGSMCVRSLFMCVCLM